MSVFAKELVKLMRNVGGGEAPGGGRRRGPRGAPPPADAPRTKQEKKERKRQVQAEGVRGALITLAGRVQEKNIQGSDVVERLRGLLRAVDSGKVSAAPSPGVGGGGGGSKRVGKDPPKGGARG